MKTYLYGIANREGRYEVRGYAYLESPSVSIGKLKEYASWVKINASGDIEHVFAIDDRPGLARAYFGAKKSNTFTDNIAFLDILEREGLKII